MDSCQLEAVLALGQVPADIPEGFATIATFKRQGMSRWTRLLLAASFVAPILLGTTLGYWVVRGRPELVKLGLLAFTAGVLVLAAVEEMLPEAHQNEELHEEPRVAALIFVGGFALFALLSTYLG
jgi:ZIP family zinc transporter